MYLDPQQDQNVYGNVDWTCMLNLWPDVFAIELARKYKNLRVFGAFYKDQKGKECLIHAWCIDEKLYFYDARGKTHHLGAFSTIFGEDIDIFDDIIEIADYTYVKELFVNTYRPTEKENGYTISKFNILAKEIINHPIGIYLYSPVEDQPEPVVDYYLDTIQQDINGRITSVKKRKIRNKK